MRQIRKETGGTFSTVGPKTDGSFRCAASGASRLHITTNMCCARNAGLSSLDSVFVGGDTQLICLMQSSLPDKIHHHRSPSLHECEDRIPGQKPLSKAVNWPYIYPGTTLLNPLPTASEALQPVAEGVTDNPITQGPWLNP